VTDSFQQRFGGTQRLYGTDAIELFQSANICVVGIGGVGSWAAEALARSAIGTITLIDLDDICITNTNRQIHALDGNIGRSKVEAMAERIKLINPDCKVDEVEDFIITTVLRVRRCLAWKPRERRRIPRTRLAPPNTQRLAPAESAL